MSTYTIAVLPGDGVGPEVVAEAEKTLKAVQSAFPDLRLSLKAHPVGAACYVKTGTDLPDATLEGCREADAILFGSAGLPDVRFADGTEIAPQISLRFILDLYAGIRPIKKYDGVPPLLAGDPPIDYVVVRENTEGLYASRDAGVRVGGEVAVDNMVITRKGTQRIVRSAFELSRERQGAPADGKRRVTCVDKANVVVAENMFGDIISDLAAATIGGLGLAPSADIGDKYGVFQPSHGTAPDIAGQGIANPIGQILSASMMLVWLGERNDDPVAIKAAEAIDEAVGQVLKDPANHTADLGGTATTSAVGTAVAAAVKATGK